MLTPRLWRRLSDDTELFDVICQHDMKLTQQFSWRDTRSLAVVVMLALWFKSESQSFVCTISLEARERKFSFTFDHSLSPQRCYS